MSLRMCHCFKTSNLISVLLIFVIRIASVRATDLGWVKIKAIPASYLKLSTQNVLRCGKICERQGKCAATTFDYRDRVCFLHDTVTVEVENGTTGRLLFKKYTSNPQNHRSTCNKDIQIAVPSAQAGGEACADIKVSETTATTQELTTSTTEAVTSESEAPSPTEIPTETTTSIQELTTSTTESVTSESEELSSTEITTETTSTTQELTTSTTEAVTSESEEPSSTETTTNCANTFAFFPKMGITGCDQNSIVTSLDECVKLCLQATNFKCLSFDIDTQFSKCCLHAIGPSDKPNLYIPYSDYDFYLRNCV